MLLPNSLKIFHCPVFNYELQCICTNSIRSYKFEETKFHSQTDYVIPPKNKRTFSNSVTKDRIKPPSNYHSLTKSTFLKKNILTSVDEENDGVKEIRKGKTLKCSSGIEMETTTVQIRFLYSILSLKRELIFFGYCPFSRCSSFSSARISSWNAAFEFCKHKKSHFPRLF